MLFIVNISEKYREKGVQDYTIRIGAPENYSTLGNFSIKNSSSVSDIFKKAAQAVSSYNPMYEMLSFMENYEKNKSAQPHINIITLTVSNISKVYNKGGIQNYEIGIVEYINGEIKHNKIVQFEHLYEDGANICFEKASESIDKSIYLPSYKKFISDRKLSKNKQNKP